MSATIESVRRFAQRYEDRIAELGARLAKAEAERDMLQLEVEDLRKKVGRMAETDARWDAMRRDLENTIAERDECYMKLPVDADGVPIRPGETLYEGEREIPGNRVYAVNDKHVYIWRYGEASCITGVYANTFTHQKPETVESLLAQFATASSGASIEMMNEYLADYGERIRKAVER